MYPATIFNWHDNSFISTGEASGLMDDAPLFMQVFSADKGTEDYVEIYGKDFDAMYGKLSFEKHGQAAIQAKAIVDAGARLFCKRVVATDAKLANIVFCANVTPLADDAGVKVKWTAQSISNCKTFDEVKAAALGLLNDSTGVYPLFVFTDNGRGVSNKAIKLKPDYTTSKTVGKTFYTLVVCEGTSVGEQRTISFDPTVVYSDVAYRLDKYATTQVSGEVIESVYDLYLAKIADLTTVDVDTLRNYDIVYGYTNRGAALPKFTLDATGVDLDADLGVLMKEGSNGNFGDYPITSTALKTELVKAFNGSFSDEIYDVDQHKLAAICDANYPAEVKSAIFELVTFRKDCVFFRDYGVGLNTFLEIKAVHTAHALERNYFVADYSTTYQIKDPTSKKNIEVTMMYDFAPALARHIANNPYAPCAGTVNGFILENAIKGTLNYVPVITPSVNQKEAMDEIRVNYAAFQDDQCVVQTTYTAQEPWTQLSYVNHVLSIQRVLRAVRTACPKQRFSLSTGTDLNNYAAAVNDVLSNFTTNFAKLNFIYTQDELKISQKIFYASIEFAFLSWAQTEIFDIYAINSF